MTWKKIVQATAVSACPRCGNAVFDLESGEDLDDPSANVRCGAAGDRGTAPRGAPMIESIYVYLPDEAVDVWAPVDAEHVCDDCYRIVDCRGRMKRCSLGRGRWCVVASSAFMRANSRWHTRWQIRTLLVKHADDSYAR